GDVYAGYDEKLERKVAVKVLNADQRLDDDARDRLLREARALSKLDHPNICRIHDYIESGDADLLVLEYIDGRTLHETLSAKMPRSEKLRIAVAIAEVLVQAHRAGIVHRDLKPENVMITKTGEVKVLDFGLARWLHRSRPRSSDRHPAVRIPIRSTPEHAGATLALPEPMKFDSSAVRRDYLATAVGITLGTPIFMSPEQARGESLTPASDMFSFGLLLQVLFTGKDPHPFDLTAREIILRVARGVTLPVEGAPGDVTALINRLKQTAPADRPTAIETLERLQFLADKGQRIARRAIVGTIALIATLGGWRYTVDLKAERAIAVAARAEAEQRRAQADDLIEFMLGDLKKKLGTVGRLDVLDDVGEQALKYVQSLHPESMTAEEIARSAKALNQLGEVRTAQGHLDDALRVFERSRALTAFAARRDTNSPLAQLAFATSNFYLGDVYRRQGKLPEALRHYGMYLGGAERLAKAYPFNDDYQLERAYGHSSVASVYELKGEFARALEHLRITRAIAEERVRARPADIERQADLARNLNRTGLVLQRSGDFRGAREHYEREFRMYAHLAEIDPRNTRWQDRLFVSHNYLGRFAEMTGDLDAALQHHAAAISLIRVLTERDPQNSVWRRNYAIAQMMYGDALRMRGDVAAARPAIQDAQRVLETLTRRNDALSSWQRDLGNVRSAAARLALQSGDVAGAIRAGDAAVALFVKAGDKDAETPRYLADGLLILGNAHAANHDQAAAAAAWSRAIDLTAPMARRNDRPEALDIMARCFLRLNRNADAAPLIQRLERIGYRAPDYVHSVTSVAAQHTG
nr:serine/threonine-protein kinase [Acidobacteriota bacterium]